MDPSSSVHTSSILIAILQILVGGICTVVSILFGFRAAVREFGIKLQEGLQTKIGLDEYREAQSDMHGKLNRANEKNVAQDKEIEHLKATLKDYKALLFGKLMPKQDPDATPPGGIPIPK